MDDAKDDLRVQTASVFNTFFQAISQWRESLTDFKTTLNPEDLDKIAVIGSDGALVEIDLDRGHFETIVERLLVHMDDTNSQVQEMTCNAILAGINVIPLDIIKAQVENTSKKHRSGVYLDLITQKF